MLGSKDEDVILLDEPGENVHVNIRHTKDYRFVTVNVFSTTYSKVSYSLLAEIFTHFINLSFNTHLNCNCFLGLSDQCSRSFIWFDTCVGV